MARPGCCCGQLVGAEGLVRWPAPEAPGNTHLLLPNRLTDSPPAQQGRPRGWSHPESCRGKRNQIQ